MAKKVHIVFGKYWQKDFSSNNNVLDNFVGSPSPRFNPFKNYSTFFDGASSLDRTNDTNLSIGTSDATFQVRFKTPSQWPPPSTKCIFEKGGSFGPTSKEYSMTIDTVGRIKFGVNDGSVNWVNFVANVLSANTIYKVDVVLDRTGSQDMYLDGVLVATQSVTNTVDISKTYDFNIGLLRNISSFHYVGEIIEFCMFDEVRSIGQMSNDLNLSKKKALIFSQNL